MKGNAASYNLPAAAITARDSNANVKYAPPDRAGKGTLEFAEPTVNADLALQAGYNGTAVGVAMIAITGSATTRIYSIRLTLRPASSITEASSLE